MTGIKYRADTIMAMYNVRCIRLPPYHPELNPIGNTWIPGFFSHFSATWAFRVHSMLSGFGVPYFFFGPLFFCTSTSDIFHDFFFHFSATRAFRVHSILSGFGVPYFFLARCFSTSPLNPLWTFSVINFSVFQLHEFQDSFQIFQLLGHSVSTQCWVDSECPIFFWPIVFLYLHLAHFRHFPWFFFFIFQLLGHFVSTQFWVDSECPYFFFVRHFFVPPVNTFQTFYMIFFHFSILSVLYPLNLKWIWSVL